MEFEESFDRGDPVDSTRWFIRNRVFRYLYWIHKNVQTTA